MMPTDFFEDAFWKVIKEDGVIADQDALMRLLPKFKKLEGDPRKAIKAIQKWLPEGAWSWPAYTEHAKSQGEDEDYEDMCRIFYSRVIRATYAAHRAVQVDELRAVNPYLIFRPGLQHKPECSQRDGEIRRCDDPYWKHYPMPCSWLECQCRVFSIGRRDIDKMQNPKIILGTYA